MIQEPQSPVRAGLEPTLLIFPATHPDGLQFIEALRDRGENFVAATSEWSAQTAREVDELIVLPYVHEPTFQARFLNLLEQRNITRIYAPVAAVHSWLSHFIEKNRVPVRLIGLSPIQREQSRFQKLKAKVAGYRGFIDDCAGGASDLSDLEIAAVLRLASTIYGESNEEKIAAMMAIFSSAPKGDVIEIGTLVGKSVAVLLWLARRYQVGNVLSIDPWRTDAATQHDSPETVRVHMISEWDFGLVPEIFITNLLQLGGGCFNYLQQESEQGFQTFQRDRAIESQAFGRIGYQGRISVIHIDGNHDYDKVKLDCDLWLPLMAEDGWLILDDYQWIHGDGPRRVGDALLVEYANNIERSFTCGKALFVKFHP